MQVGYPSLPRTEGFPRTRDFQPWAHWGLGCPSGETDEGLEAAWRRGPGRAHLLLPFYVEFPSEPPRPMWWFSLQGTTPCWEAGGDTGRRSERQPLNQLQAPTETTIAGKEAEMLDWH